MTNRADIEEAASSIPDYMDWEIARTSSSWRTADPNWQPYTCSIKNFRGFAFFGYGKTVKAAVDMAMQRLLEAQKRGEKL